MGSRDVVESCAVLATDGAISRCVASQGVASVEPDGVDMRRF